MSNFFARHFEHDLVRYLDGALSPRHARKIEHHLESCGTCRAELEALRNAVADCAVYREELTAQMPAAPAPWRDLYRDFSRIDESLANNSLLVRLMRPLVHSGVPRWTFVVGLATLVVLLSLNQLRQAPSVQAAALLSKAIAVSQSQAPKVRRIRVRSSRQVDFTRLTGAQAALVEVAQVSAVAALFQEAKWDWNNPLSAQAFEQWRDRQVHKTDEVSLVEDPQFPSEHLTRIRTVAGEGELEAASITIDTGDFDAVSERLEFRDRDWVELSQIAEPAPENAGGSGVNTVGVPVRAAELPSRPAALAPGSPASISDEIQVLSALSGIGADLGDPVEVTLSEGKVLVSGEGIPERRQEQIRAAVGNLPHVDIAFTPMAAVAVTARVAGSTASGAVLPPSAKGLEKYSEQLQDLDDAAGAHATALHNLAVKFPADQEAALSAADLGVIHDLSRKHTTALAEKVKAMEQILVPALPSLGGAAVGAHPASHAGWQPATDDILSSAHNVDLLISQLLGMTEVSKSSKALPSDLLSALATLKGNLDDCSKLLK